MQQSKAAYMCPGWFTPTEVHECWAPHLLQGGGAAGSEGFQLENLGTTQV